MVSRKRRTRWANAQAFNDSQAGLATLLLSAILVIDGILSILCESSPYPTTIVSGLAFPVLGGLAALLVTGQALSLFAFISLVVPIGVVKKNIIMMPTIAAIVGTMPIALGLAGDAASRRPLGINVAGGLAFSQLVTLYPTPVLYTYFDALQERIGIAPASASWRSDRPRKRLHPHLLETES